MTNGTGVFDPRPEEVMAAKVLGGEEMAGEIDPLDPERDPIQEESDPILADIRKRVQKLRREERNLKERLSILTPELKRYEKALLVLSGEPIKGYSQATSRKVLREQRKTWGISEEKLDEVRQAIFSYAEDHDEFRQVDIRGVVDIRSGIAAIAFERLRQENTIRLARKSGNNKYFRLTREALNG